LARTTRLNSRLPRHTVASWLHRMQIFCGYMQKEHSTRASPIAWRGALTVGELLRRLVLIYDLLSVEEMKNRIEFL
jgi:hypothetical protein